MTLPQPISAPDADVRTAPELTPVSIAGDTRPPLLQARGISKSFGALQVLDDVDVSMYAGEVLAVVGDNGAGKSTLIKTIAGSHRPDAGAIWFEGRRVHIDHPRDAVELGIEVVFQDLALCDNLTVAQNMFLGREQRSRWGFLSDASMQRQAARALSSLGVTTVGSMNQTVARLSGGQRQSVAVARAVMWNSKVVILDEPTAALGVVQTQQVLELVRRLAESGLSVVIISHILDDLFQVADRFAVLRLGRKVAEFDRATTTRQEVIDAITGGTHRLLASGEVAWR